MNKESNDEWGNTEAWGWCVSLKCNGRMADGNLNHFNLHLKAQDQFWKTKKPLTHKYTITTQLHKQTKQSNKQD